MTVIGIAASPRKNGNSETLLDWVISGLTEGGVDVLKIRTHELSISPCTNCGECSFTGRCVIDDQFQDITRRLIACDGVVFATPLYFMNVPAGGKAFIDRCQVFWAAKYQLKLDLFGGRRRTGLLVACSGAGYGPGKAPVFRGLEDTMTYVFKALSLEPQPNLLFSRVDGKGAINADQNAIQLAYNSGFQMAETIKTIYNNRKD